MFAPLSDITGESKQPPSLMFLMYIFSILEEDFHIFFDLIRESFIWEEVISV